MAPLVAAAIIGAGASLASSASSLYGASQERAAAQKAKNNANRQISAWEQRANQILQESEAKATKLSGSGDVAKYREMRDSYDPSKYVVDAQPFDKSGYSVEDYLNPNREAIKANISKQVASTAAGAGLGHSSGALEAYIDAALAKDEELYKEARDKLTMCAPEEFDTLYAQYAQEYLDAGYQEVIDERAAAWEAGNSTHMLNQTAEEVDLTK
jgi:hypothetical protein